MNENKETREEMNEELYDEVVGDAAFEEAEKKFEESIEENKIDKKQNKKKIIFLVVALILIVVCGIVLVLSLIPKKEEKKDKPKNESALYEAAINEYGTKAYGETLKFMLANGNKLPEWNDINETIGYTKYKINCKISLINKDSTVYLEDCKIKGMDYYDAKFTFGVKLPEEIVNENATKMYVVQWKEYDSDYTFMVTEFDPKQHKLIKEYNCKTTGCIPYRGGEGAKIIIFDGSNYIYDYKKGTVDLIDIGDEKFANVNLITYDDKDYGAIVSKDNRTIYETAYYSLLESKYIVDFSKEVSISTHGELLNQGYLFKTVYGTSTTDLVNIKTGKVVNTFANTNVSYINNNDYMYFYEYEYNDNLEIHIYNNKYKKILSTAIADHDRIAVNSNGNIMIYDSGSEQVNIYDPNGKVVRSVKQYNRILKIVNDYIMIVDDDNIIKLMNSNDKEVAKFDEWNDSFSFAEYESGIVKYNGNDCVFIIVEDENLEYGTTGYAKGYYYDLKTKKTGRVTGPAAYEIY